MPLIEGKSKASVSKNIATEMDAGKKQDQAVAIAMSEKRKAEHHHYHEGGEIEHHHHMADGGEIHVHHYSHGGKVVHHIHEGESETPMEAKDDEALIEEERAEGQSPNALAALMHKFGK